MTSQAGPGDGSGLVGSRLPRLDAADKLTGAAQYAADAHLPGLLHARPVLSLYAHARIRSIDVADALAVTGVAAVLTAADLPFADGIRGVIDGRGKPLGRAVEPLAESEVVFAGQPVALVLADSEAAAEDGAALVVVDYEPLEAVLDVEQAILAGALPARIAEGVESSDAELHGAAGGDAPAAEGEVLSANVVDRRRFSSGDLDAGFARSAEIAEGEFRTAWVHQTYLEPMVALAWPEPGGRLAVRTSTQAAFFTRAELARLFGLPLGNVRVEPATLGGGFGAKIRLIEPLVAGAALAVGRPVRLVFTRSEDFAAANPSPGMSIGLRVGAQADGTIAALEARILIDGGAFADTSPAALAGGRVAGPYRVGAWVVDTYGVRTNRCGAGSYRGPTAVQLGFALESLLDELAVRLDLDPIELRRRNAASRGDERIDGSRWPPTGLRETLAAVEDHPLWRRRDNLPEDEGVGLAAGLFPGARFGAAATCRMDSDGGFTLVTGYVDVTGTDTAVAAIAADVLGLPIDRVRIVHADTDSAPHSGVSGGSMVTYVLGSAVLAAAKDARRQLLEYASRELEIDSGDLELADGAVRPRGAPSRGLTLEAIAANVTGFSRTPQPPIEGHGNGLPPELAPSAAVALAHVRVDRDTGEVTLLDYVAAQDAGTVINPALVEGQMRGGAAQSIGIALSEQLDHDAGGQLLNGSLLTYAIPRMQSLPPLQTIVVSVPSEHGPLGAKGIGESALAAGAAAVANAIAAATGTRPRELPMTPRRIWEAIQSGSGSNHEGARR